MRKHVLLASLAALCTTVSAANATPIAPAPVAVEIIKPVTYYGYGYRHGFFRHYYQPYYYYPHYGYDYYSYPRFHRYWY